MKKFTTILLTMLLVVGIILLFSCGDDDGASSKLKEGNPNDPNFLFISSLLNADMLGVNMIFIDLSGELIDSIAEGAGKSAKISAGESDFEQIIITNYTYENYWHIFSLLVRGTGGVEEGVDSIFFDGIDSIRFEGASGPMQYPDSLLTTLVKLRYHFDVEAYAPEGQLAVSDDGAIDLAGQMFGDFTFSGATSDSLSASGEDTTMAIDVDVTMNQNFDGLLIDSMVQYEDACPGAGTAGVVATIDLVMVTVNVDPPETYSLQGRWTADFVFHADRSVTITYTDGQSQWIVTEDCSNTPPPVKLSWPAAAKAVYK